MFVYMCVALACFIYGDLNLMCVCACQCSFTCQVFTNA